MKVWRHYLFNYLLFTILHKSECNLKFQRAHESNRKSCEYCFRRFEEFARESVVKFSGKLLPANVGFANCSGLKFSLDFQNT